MKPVLSEWFYFMATPQEHAFRTEDFDFELPADLIAQHPTPDARDRARLLAIHRRNLAVSHRSFPDHVDFLQKGDLLILNNTKVIPARLRGEKQGTGGKMELLLVEETQPNQWLVMLKPGKRVRPGTRINLHNLKGNLSNMSAEVLDKTEDGRYRVAFSGIAPILDCIDELGEMPLPPYIQRKDHPTEEDKERYQTVYADPRGSVAAPTAGLHYTPELLDHIRNAGVEVAWVTLHVGLGTFAPVQAEWITDHKMHEERFQVSTNTLKAIQKTRSGGGKITAVGTTSLRVMESLARIWQPGQSTATLQGRTDIFIYPPYDFKLTDQLITNFHLPKSTLLMLVSAFASPGKTDGLDLIRKAYQEAIQNRYRFFSYGDAMILA